MADELRLRTRMIGVGLGLSVLLLAAVGTYVAVTWHQPHRPVLGALVAAAAAITVGVACLPRERIVRGRLREPFFLGWSLSLIGFIVAAAWLDGGVRSPLMLTLFLTLAYAALSYPRRLVMIVSATSVAAVIALAELGPTGRSWTGSPDYVAGLVLTLSVTGIMCVLQTRLQEESRAELRRVSRSDPLTGALNRLGFAERMAAEMRRAASDGTPVGLVVLDFDGFKEVNDARGHAAGDALLCWGVMTMRGVLRPGDALARLGGDEFAALLPATDASGTAEVADRLRFSLSLQVSACSGYATTDVDETDPERLHRLADTRLYAAKRRRGDRDADVAAC